MSDVFDGIGLSVVSVAFAKGGGTKADGKKSLTNMCQPSETSEDMMASFDIYDDIMKRKNEEMMRIQDEKITKAVKTSLVRWIAAVNLPSYARHNCMQLKCVYKPLKIERRANHTCVFGLNVKACTGIGSMTKNAQCPKTKVLWTVDDVYVCENTGNPHWCGEKCKFLSKTHKNGDLVCSLTAITVQRKRVVGEFWRPNCNASEAVDTETKNGAKLFQKRTRRGGKRRGYMTRDEIRLTRGIYTCNNFSEWLYQLTLTQKFDAIDKHMEYGIEVLAPEGGLEHYKIIACAKLFYLFCEQRYSIDQDRMANTDQQAEAKIKDILKRQDEESKMLTWVDLDEIYTREICLRRARTFRLYPKNSMTKTEVDYLMNFLIEYSNIVIRFWCTIRAKTNIGKTNAAKFKFDKFVLPAIYTLWVGLEVPVATLGTFTTILRRDDKLSLVLPEEHIISYIIGIHSDFTQFQRNILDAFNGAVLVENKSESDLRIDKIDFSRYCYLFTAVVKSRSIKRRRRDESV